MFTAKDGKTYEDVLLEPRGKIACVHCGKKVALSTWQLIAPPNAVYECACGQRTIIHCEYTRSHWPEDIQREYVAVCAEWYKNGCVVKEEVGFTIHNGAGIARINLDKG